MTKTIDPDALLDQEAAAELLCVASRSLEHWRRVGRGPVHVRIEGRTVRYRRQDLLDYIQQRIRKSTRDTGTPEPTRRRRRVTKAAKPPAQQASSESVSP